MSSMRSPLIVTRITNVGTRQAIQASRSPYGFWPGAGAADLVLLERGSNSKAMRISTAASSNKHCLSAQWHSAIKADWVRPVAITSADVVRPA